MAQIIPGASLPYSVINQHEDMFVIEVYKDASNRSVMLCYGFGWKGTYAAGKYFNTMIYLVLPKFYHPLPTPTHTSTTPTTTTITITSETTVYTNPTSTITAFQSDRGIIEIDTYNTSRTFYAYTRWNDSFPSKFTFNNVTFNRWTITTITNTAGSCYGGVGGYGGYLIVFQDGSTENMSTCTLPSPAGFVDISLTKHTNPQAGFLIIPQSDAFYFLVSV